MPIKGDSWFDDDGQLDFEEVQDDTSWLADMAGVFQRHETNKLLRKQQKEREAAKRRYQARKDCPYCGAKLPKVGAEICMHCRNKMSWVGSTPCKPGEEGETKQLHLQKQKEMRKNYEAYWEKQSVILAEKRANAAEVKKLLRDLKIGAWVFCIAWFVAMCIRTGVGGSISLGDIITSSLTTAGVVTSIYAFVLWLWRRR